jgi:hypothetical protein
MIFFLKLLAHLSITADVRRTWCAIVCTGVATQEDVETLQQFVRDTSNIITQKLARVQTALNAMASYSKVADQKFDAIKYILERQQYNQYLGEQSVRRTQVFVGLLANLFLPNAIHLPNVRSSLILLKHNVMTFDILPFSHAKLIMQEIKQHVSQWPLRHLVHTDPMSLYKEADTVYFRTKSHLHIGLKIKVSYFKQPLQLFKVETFQLGIPNQEHSSIIQNLPPIYRHQRLR